MHERSSEHEDDMIIDHHRVNEITRNNSKLLKSISQLFFNELPDMIKAVDTAYQQNDRQSIAKAIHRLKSALGNFVNSEYYKEFSQLEASASGMTAPVIHLNEWLSQWEKAKLDLETLVVDLKEMAGI